MSSGMKRIPVRIAGAIAFVVWCVLPLASVLVTLLLLKNSKWADENPLKVVALLVIACAVGGIVANFVWRAVRSTPPPQA